VYNLRYHIASLVAVFLALSLGLLLGGITVQSGVLTRQRAALVQSLRSDYAKLSSKNQGLQEDLRLEKQLAGAMVDDSIAGRLDGKNVLVLTNAGQVDGLSATEASIRSAGGTPHLVTLSNPGLGLEEAEIASSVASSLPEGPGRDILTAVTEELATEWAAGASGPVTEALVKAGVFDGPKVPPAGFDGVVDLATFDGKADPGALGLAVALQRAGEPSVGAQSRFSKSTLASEANSAGLSALDTLGTETGRYALVMLLSGAQPGYYGVGQGTLAPFPPPAEMR
jgi:hypothetical protein